MSGSESSRSEPARPDDWASRAARGLREEALLGMALPRLDRYEIHEEIGRGGMAIVYRATDTVLRRTVAL